jgi:hypothetical protein
VFLCLLAICGSAAGQQYFPDHTFDEQDKVKDFTVSWYSRQLKALKEDPLWQLPNLLSDRFTGSYGCGAFTIPWLSGSTCSLTEAGFRQQR